MLNKTNDNHPYSWESDFLAEANRRQRESIYFPGVIYAHQMLVSIGDCIQDLELIAQVGEAKDLANSVPYLPL